MASCQLLTGYGEDEEVEWVPGVAADAYHGQLETPAGRQHQQDSDTSRSSCVPPLERCGSPVHSGKRPGSCASIGSPGSTGSGLCSRVPWVPAGISSGIHHHPARTYPTSPRNSLGSGGPGGSPGSSTTRVWVPQEGGYPAGCTCGSASWPREGPLAAPYPCTCSWVGLEGSGRVDPPSPALPPPSHLGTAQRAAAEELLAAVQRTTLADGTDLLQQQLGLLRALQDLLSVSMRPGPHGTTSSSSSSGRGGRLPGSPSGPPPSSAAATVLRVKRLQCRVLSLQHQVLLLLGSRGTRAPRAHAPHPAAAEAQPVSLIRHGSTASTKQSCNKAGGRSVGPPAAVAGAGQEQPLPATTLLKQQQQQQQQPVQSCDPPAATSSSSLEGAAVLLVPGPPGTIFKRRLSAEEVGGWEVSFRPLPPPCSSSAPGPQLGQQHLPLQLPDTSPSFRVHRSSSDAGGVLQGQPLDTPPADGQGGSSRRRSSSASRRCSDGSSSSSRGAGGGTSSRGALVLAAALAADNRVLAAEVAALQQLLVAERVAGWRTAEAMAAALAGRLTADVADPEQGAQPGCEPLLLSPVAPEEAGLLTQLEALEQELEQMGTGEGVPQQEQQQEPELAGSSHATSQPPGCPSVHCMGPVQPPAAAAAAEQLVEVADQLRRHYLQQDWGSQVAALLEQVRGGAPLLAREVPGDVEALSRALAAQLGGAEGAPGGGNSGAQRWEGSGGAGSERLLMAGGASLAAYVTTPSGHVTPCGSRRATGTIPGVGNGSCSGSWSGAQPPMGSNRCSTRLSRSQNNSMHRAMQACGYLGEVLSGPDAGAGAGAAVFSAGGLATSCGSSDTLISQHTGGRQVCSSGRSSSQASSCGQRSDLSVSAWGAATPVESAAGSEAPPAQAWVTWAGRRSQEYAEEAAAAWQSPQLATRHWHSEGSQE